MKMKLVVKDYQIKKEAGELLELTVVYRLWRNPFQVTPDIIAEMLKKVFSDIEFESDLYGPTSKTDPS